jgi:glycosyltransferase involved in cell wall biosynthesis
VAERRLLYLSPELPDPEGNGGEVRLFRIVSDLAARGERIRLIAPATAEKVERGLALRAAGVDLRPVVRPPSPAREALSASFAEPRVAAALVRRSWLAWQAEVYLHELRRELADALSERWDAAIVEHDWALGWVRALPAELPVGLVFQNLTDALLERQAETESGPRRLWRRRDARLARAEVDRSIGRVSQAFACSTDDAGEITRRWDVPCAVVPNGADVEHLASVAEDRQVAGRLLFTGTMSYPPNAQAARWLVERVLPAIRARRPDVTLTIVGRDPPAAVRQLAGAGVTVTGRVPDLASHFAGAAVVVAPLLSGSGTKLKVLEAMAAGRPVVATTVGAEGIEARDGEHLRVADAPEEFAAAVAALLDDRAEAARIARNGRELVAGRYGWPASGERMARALDAWLGPKLVSSPTT